MPELLKPEVARRLQELLDLGFIRKSTSAMASPIVCVLKGRNGENGVRLCCDYRYLNKYTSGDAYPTPDITDVIHVTLGFISQRTHSNRPKVRMPFGLKCASNSFIRALQQL